MKKKLLILLMSACVCFSAACGGGVDISGYETVTVETDRAVYSNLDELLDASDIVIVGEVCSDAEQKLTYGYSEEYGKDVLTDAVSTSRVSVSQVLYGDFNGKEVRVSQRYGVLEKEKQVTTFSALTPMKKNDRWIFFLRYDSVNDTYWCTGDCCGRMPIFEGVVENITREYMRLQNEFDEILRQNASVPLDEIDEYYSEGSIIFYDSAYNAYALDYEQSGQAVVKMAEMDEVRANTAPHNFGVYRSDDIDFALYSEAVRYFKL